MRAIEFRVWDEEEQVMVSPDSITRNGFATWERNSRTTEMTNANIMQFTGLLDKNGKKIFEGDVIHCDNGSVGTIIYYAENMMYKVDSSGKCGFCHPVYGYAPPFEVIGNIYENPKLLEEA